MKSIMILVILILITIIIMLINKTAQILSLII